MEAERTWPPRLAGGVLGVGNLEADRSKLLLGVKASSIVISSVAG